MIGIAIFQNILLRLHALLYRFRTYSLMFLGSYKILEHRTSSNTMGAYVCLDVFQYLMNNAQDIHRCEISSPLLKVEIKERHIEFIIFDAPSLIEDET